MQRTDNFNLIVVEGSDTVNLLTQMNPNIEVIDEQMFKNQNAGVQTATELLSGTVHAITRSIPDASMIRFTAVSRFTAGDTFTVDGVQVSALLPSGEQLPDGAYIIGSEVLCVLKGTLLTVFASGGAVALARDAEKLGGQLPSYYATKAEVDSAQETADSAGSLAELNKQSIVDINDNLTNEITQKTTITLLDGVTSIDNNIDLSFRNNGVTCSFNIDISINQNLGLVTIMRGLPPSKQFTIIPCVYMVGSTITPSILSISGDTLSLSYATNAGTRIIASGVYPVNV